MSADTEVMEMDADLRAIGARTGLPFGLRVQQRLYSMEQFIALHGSGTLRKNHRLGFRTREHYLHERAAFEFGAGWECLPVSRVRWGDAISEPDCHPVTEAGWYADRYLTVCLFPGDRAEVKSIEVEYSDGTKREGIGLVLRATSAPWVPPGHLGFAIIAEWDPQSKSYREAINVC